MNNQPLLKKPKYPNIKFFIFSLSLSMILWVWGMLSTRDLINNAIYQSTSLPAPSAVITNSGNDPVQPSAALRKVQAPTPLPAVITNSKRLPLTNTGSSRP